MSIGHIRNAKDPCERARSNIVTDDKWTGASVSFIFEGNAWEIGDPVVYNEGMCVNMNIGPKGGHIEVSGVTVDIPEGIRKSTVASSRMIYR